MKVLIVEPIGSGAALVNAAVELGWDCYILSYNKDDRKLPITETWKNCKILEIDTNDEHSVISYLNTLSIKFDVIVSGNEYYVPLTIQLTNHYNIIGLPKELEKIAHNKLEMRKFLKEKGIRSPWFTSVSNVNELEHNKTITFPCIIKPKEAAGSYHVNKAYTKEELITYYLSIQNETHKELSHTLGSEVLIEEYLEQPEYSVEGYFSLEKLHFVSITKKFLSKEPYFVEIGHITPTTEISIQQKDLILNYVRDILEATGVKYGVFHCEIRFNNEHLPTLVEIAYRLPGDRIVDLINISYNIDLAKAMLLSYAGLPYNPPPNSNTIFAGIAFYHDNTNLKDYRDRKGFEIIKNVDEHMVLSQLQQIWNK